MKNRAKWFLAILVGGIFAAPSIVAQSQPSRLAPRPVKRPHVRIRRPPSSVPQSLVSFAGGVLQMGANAGDPDARPVHTVTVNPFRMQRHEVTVAEYKKCLNANKCTVPAVSSNCNWGKAGRENHPVNCVDYYQATNYCSYLGMRLPTEQEWELAAKSPDNRTYPWGQQDVPTTQLCWKAGSTCAVGSHPTGRSAKGLDDLSGNVAEWTASPFCSYQAGGCTTTARAVRGGGWSMTVPTEVQTSSRAGFNKGVRSATIGFRCVGAPSPS